MPTQNFFHAWIEIGDKIVDEYNIKPSSNGRVVTCWIASEAGKNFSVNWRYLVDNCAIQAAGCVTIDGYKCGGTVFSHKDSSMSTSLRYIRTSSTTTKPFLFSKIDFTGSTDSFSSSQHVVRLGEIKLSILKLQAGDVILRETGVVSPEFPKIHGEARTTISHHMVLGQDSAHEQGRKIVDVVPANGRPLVTFIFKYRPAEQLKAIGILPNRAHQSISAIVKTEVKVESELCLQKCNGDIKTLKTLKEGIGALLERKRRKIRKTLKKYYRK